MTHAELERELRLLETTGTNFALRLARMADVRSTYVKQIKEMSNGIREAVKNGELSPKMGAKMAHEMRNKIMEMQRLRDLDLGKSLARQMKSKGLSLDDAISKALKKLKLDDIPFEKLSGPQQRQVYLEVVEGAGRSRPSVTGGIPKLRYASRGLWIASLAIAGYSIGTSEHPWWQTGREAANLAGGVGGGFAGGAAAGAAGGAIAGPPGVVIGAIVGGILGALLADHAYMEAVGAADPRTRTFIDRFTSFWTGVDEEGMAKALAREKSHDPQFIERVFISLANDYNSDSDDIAHEFVKVAKSNLRARNTLKSNDALRTLLIKLLEGGWTTASEKSSIAYLASLKAF